MRNLLKISAGVLALILMAGLLLPDGPPGIVGRFALDKKADIEHYLLEGDEVKSDEFQFAASLGTADGNDYFHGCGGALLAFPGTSADKKWILTAAHCAQHRAVVFGKLDLKRPIAILGSMSVEKAYCHAGYMSGGQDDIALLELKLGPLEVVPFKGISPSESNLPESQGEGGGASVTLLGWGEEGVLRRKDVDLKSLDFCRSAHVGTPVAINDSVICTKSIGPHVGVARNKDSGGPAVMAGKLVGVIFIGNNPGKPDIHADVGYYYPWIKAVINGESKDVDDCYGSRIPG